MLFQLRLVQRFQARPRPQPLDHVQRVPRLFDQSAVACECREYGRVVIIGKYPLLRCFGGVRLFCCSDMLGLY